MRSNSGKRIVLLLALLLALPWVLHSDYLLNFAIMVLYAALLGQAWNILGGYGGQFSFGHAAFFGTGAYTVGVLQVSLGVNPWLGLAAALAAGALCGAVVGFLSFHYGLKGSYFALVTLAFAEVLRILSNYVSFTGAGVGLLIPLHRTAANFQFPDKTGFYWVILGFTALALAVAWWLENSRFGAWLIAVRENDNAARALGIDVFRVKLAAITLSGALMAAGGAFYTQYFLYLDPYIAYGPAVSVEALLVAIIGGMGTLFGPLLGAFTLHLLSELARGVFGDVPGLNMVLYGVLLVLMVKVMPDGLAGLARRVSRHLTGERS